MLTEIRQRNTWVLLISLRHEVLEADRYFLLPGFRAMSGPFINFPFGFSSLNIQNLQKLNPLVPLATLSIYIALSISVIPWRTQASNNKQYSKTEKGKCVKTTVTARLKRALNRVTCRYRVTVTQTHHRLLTLNSIMDWPHGAEYSFRSQISLSHSKPNIL